MRKLILSLVIFISFASCALAAEEKPYVTDKAQEEISLTLDEAVAIALRDNRDILLKTEDLKKAKLKISEAKASLFPALTFTGSWTNTRGLYGKDISQTQGQANLKQYIYKGGKIINTIRYNGYNFEVAEAILDKAKLELALNVKDAFYTLLLAKEFNDLNRNILANAKAHLELVQKRYKNGQASESDILSITESLSSVEEAHEASVNQVEASLSLLKNLLYLDEKSKIEPQDQFVYEPLEVAYDEGFLQAMKFRPEIRQYDAQAQANKKAIEMAKGDGRPNIYASWDYYSRSHLAGITGVNKNWNDNSIIGLTFSWPVFDGWATKAKIEQAIVDLREAQLNKEKTIKDISLELKNSYLDLMNSIARIKATEAEFTLYQDNFIVVKKKYDDGISSLLDLDDARLRYDISSFNKKQANYDYVIAKAHFEKATGGI